MCKTLVKKLLKGLGYKLTKITPENSPEVMMSKLLHHLKTDLVLDVGANEGQFASQLRHWGYCGKIISFEPLKDAHTRLSLAAKRDPLWEVAPRCALGLTQGLSKINVSKNSVSSSLKPMCNAHLSAAPESIFVRNEEVRVERLDSIAGSYPSSFGSIFMKIDAQGFEEEILDGSIGIMDHIKGMQVELSLVRLYGDQKLFFEMCTKIKTMGFDLFGIIPGFTNCDTGQMLQVDGVFIRE
jgi:FkbM family methyltransferase